ncbi:MAG: hypothetical protein VYE22_15405 [Myxococcota bacterium]|nr:hypothetical protein [Myxococcota bacterium]
MNERTGIRPSLWLFAAVFLTGAGVTAWAILDGASARRASERAATADARDPRDRRDGRAPSDRARPRHTPSSGGSYTHHDWGQESDLQRQMSLDLPGPRFWQEGVAERARDPQLFAMWRSFSAMAQDGEPTLPFEPTAHRAQIIDAEGDVDLAADSCQVRVLPVQAGSFNCVVRVVCDGAVLYPNERQTAGYVPCELENGRPVRAVDDGQSDADGDPLVDMDLQNGTITVEDFAPDGQRRYRATLRIHS